MTTLIETPPQPPAAEAPASPFGLTPEQFQSFGEELDAIRQRVLADRGERDANYIRGVIRAQRGLEVAGRGLLWAGVFPPAWIAGTAALSVSKILDNMEIGHNVMHGQYEWMNDPKLSGKQFEWDTACPADQWRHSHNYMHHTHTNIVGKDRDIGYGILRMSEEQPWNPYYLGNPLWAGLLATFFQYGVALHDVEVERIASGETTLAEKRDVLKGIWEKVRRQALKDYVVFPALSGPLFMFPLAGNATANLVRNLWSFSIIFCGHFPEGTHEFTEEETENETRGQWYHRQLLGSANLSGGPLFHIMSGNLSFQIEHHLFPDLPANRYAEISVEVQEVCERYGLPYNVGPLPQQFGSVVRKICRLALPETTQRSRLSRPAGVLLDGLGGAGRTLGGATRGLGGVVKKVGRAAVGATRALPGRSAAAR
jgi:NADPH-dependent stearoyl-CoA 9-desaturase